MGMFVEEMKFSQLSAGDYIEFTNELSGNDEAGTVHSVGNGKITVEQWDKDVDGEVYKLYFPTDISNITKIK